jgi:ABC-type Fe3+ transport system permease subunit
MHKAVALMITVLVASALVASTFAFLTFQRDIPGAGSIKGVGVGV